ncbi:MAG TPA: family 20 glycosylhydrolase [Thermomonospora sp.]|nr:family 20 glycosylhydrolase [Thermomonospora sp.]
MHLVPLPQRVTPAGGPPFRSGRRLRVTVPDPELRVTAEVAADLVTRLHGVATAVEVGGTGDLDLVLTEEPPQVAAVRGVDPLDAGPGPRERYELVVDERRATVTACSAEGLFRGATTFAQWLRQDDGLTAPAVRITDGPALAWRGLSLDVVRRFFPVEQVKQVIDLLALYRFNVLHLHLTDSQAWRLEIGGWPRLTADTPHYTHDDYREIVAYAAARFVTVVPEIDMPGHVLAAVRAYPELQGDRKPAHELLAYLDPRAEAARRFARDVLHEVAALTPGPYLHVGGDEAFGMPHELYAEFIADALEVARDTGKKVVGWQEVARSGAVRPEDLVQCWVGAGDEFDPEAARAKAPPEYLPLIDIVAESFARVPHDMPAAVAAGAWVLASPSSHLYLDRRYAEESLLAEQNAVRETVGFGSYRPRTTRELFDWDPAGPAEIPAEARIAGVEAAIWCETVRDFDDLVFLLLPRLPGIAEKAWTPRLTAWEDHRARLAGHTGWWDRLGWGAYYRSAEVFAPEA